MEDLIVKISDKCNFKCDFCSSNKIAIDHKDLDIEVLKDYMRTHIVGSIIVNGGDPLMTPPEYYEDLLDFRDKYYYETEIGFTTNLWEFYKNPDKWENILKRVGVCTSFQYGNKRKVATGEVFTEELFIKVFNLFEERIGKKLMFIAVIDEDNEDTVLQTVQLAKHLGTDCKINPCLKSGRASKAYPYARMFARYLDIIEAGLSEYEASCRLIKDAWRGNHHMCPYLFDCGRIKCMSPDGTVTRCGSISDDILTGIPAYFLQQYDRVPYDLTAISGKCYTCPFHGICNSCHKRIMDIRDSGIDEHCNNMLVQLERARRILGEQ